MVPKRWVRSKDVLCFAMKGAKATFPIALLIPLRAAPTMKISGKGVNTLGIEIVRCMRLPRIKAFFVPTRVT